MTDPSAAVPAGDRPVARAALRRLEAAPVDIRAHSLRVITIARALAVGRPVDEAMLVAACAVHDLGLLADSGRRRSGLRFPERSAAVLAELADQHRIGDDRAGPWCLAIAAHLRPMAPAGESFEAGLLRRAAWLDGTGIGHHRDRDAVRALGLSRSAPQSARLLLRIGGALVRDLTR